MFLPRIQFVLFSTEFYQNRFYCFRKIREFPVFLNFCSESPTGPIKVSWLIVAHCRLMLGMLHFLLLVTYTWRWNIITVYNKMSSLYHRKLKQTVRVIFIIWNEGSMLFGTKEARCLGRPRICFLWDKTQQYANRRIINLLSTNSKNRKLKTQFQNFKHKISEPVS